MSLWGSNPESLYGSHMDLNLVCDVSLFLGCVLPSGLWRCWSTVK